MVFSKMLAQSRSIVAAQLEATRWKHVGAGFTHWTANISLKVAGISRIDSLHALLHCQGLFYFLSIDLVTNRYGPVGGT